MSTTREAAELQVAEAKAHCLKLRGVLEVLILEYDVGDRPMAPPAYLFQCCRYAEQSIDLIDAIRAMIEKHQIVKIQHQIVKIQP